MESGAGGASIRFGGAPLRLMCFLHIAHHVYMSCAVHVPHIVRAHHERPLTNLDMVVDMEDRETTAMKQEGFNYFHLSWKVTVHTKYPPNGLAKIAAGGNQHRQRRCGAPSVPLQCVRVRVCVCVQIQLQILFCSNSQPATSANPSKPGFRCESPADSTVKDATTLMGHHVSMQASYTISGHTRSATRVFGVSDLKPTGHGSVA